MNRKNLLILLSILFIGVFTTWYINYSFYQFLPPEFNNPFVMILSILGFITAIQGAIKAIQYLGELFFPPAPSPSQNELIRQELRALTGSLSKETVRAYTNRFLGTKGDDFWEQISDTLINSALCP
jgi:hypothetical protein